MRENKFITEMIEAIMKVARGDYSVQVEPSGINDELDSLAVGLNMMIDDIKVNYQELKNTQIATLNILEDLDRRGKELKAVNKRLHREITNRKHAEESLQMKTHQLGERLKELDCLYSTFKIMTNTKQPMDEVLQKVVELIPQAWQYPETTCARITFKGKEYKTANFKQTEWGQSAEISLYGDHLGFIEVYYLQEKPTAFEGPFLKEERNLLDALVIKIGKFYDRRRIEKMRDKLFRDLENKNKELKDFAYIVSHDLKAPLRAISSLAEWIYTDNSDKLSEDSNEQLELLINRVKRMNDLINGILQYSRVGRLIEEKKPVDLNELIPEIIEGIKPLDNIDIKVLNKLPTITFEPTRIEQLFQNLLSNATKYMDKENGMITVDATAEPSFWKFSVSDNGPGIKEKYHDKIFQIFQTLKPRDEVESTGIGLTIVKKIIDLYKGKIWVDSKVGEGTTFHFTIPNSNNGSDRGGRTE